MNADFALYGRDLFGETIPEPSRGPLADAFLVPPFTVLNAREGWWRQRKQAWLAIGIRGEEGRGPSLTYSGRIGENIDEDRHKKLDPVSTIIRDTGPGATSVFDPVLCELAYRWFCPPAGLILDPFAGGSVRGIVASVLGRRYLGVELSPRQIASNEAQAEAICVDNRPQWIEGDARDVAELTTEHPDFLFTCPPYGDLERYSDDPRDLSTLSFREFAFAYRDIIARAAALLKSDRFACFVVGDYRDKAGNYSNFPAITIRAFYDAGMSLYNEAVLVTAVGSLPVRVNSQFSVSRKLGKTHQNVLIFLKGDARRAALACGEVKTYGVD